MMGSGSRATSAGWIAMLALIGMSIGLRFVGIGFLLPHQTEPDGVVFDKQVQILRDGVNAGQGTGLYAFYPHLVPRIVTLLPAPPVADATPRGLDEHLELASARRVQIREVVAVLSVLAVFGAWWLSRRFLHPTYACVAALLMGTSVFDLWFAQQARPHAVVTSLSFLAVIAAMEVRSRGTWLAWCVAGLATGLALGTLQNGLAVLPALAWAGVSRHRAAEERGSARALGGALVALAICAACVWAFYPFLFEGGERAKGAVVRDEATIHLSGHLVELGKFNGRGFPVVLRSLWEYDPILSTLSVVGLVLGASHLRARWAGLSRSARDRIWIAAAFVGPYLLAIGLFQRTYQRFALPLVPWMCVLSAYAAWRTCSLAAARGRRANAIASFGVVVVLACQSFAAWSLVSVRARPDTITEAARWIAAHVDPASRVSVMTSLDLPLLQTSGARDANETVTLDVRFPWFTHLWHLPPGAATGTAFDLRAMPLATEPERAAARADLAGFVNGLDAAYAVVEVFSDGRFPMLAGIRAEIASRGTLEARFSPDATDTGEDVPLTYQDDEFPRTTPWFWRTLRARSVGPIVEVYRLR